MECGSVLKDGDKYWKVLVEHNVSLSILREMYKSNKFKLDSYQHIPLHASQGNVERILGDPN